jgi:membrane protease YdiL (CAAX protease family)
MPAAQPSNRIVSTQPVQDYWRQSRRPLAALAFVLPLLAMYEAGVVVLGRQAVRNGADVWLRQFLDRFGFEHYFLLPALTISLLLAWHHMTRDRWQLSAGVLYVMFAECAVLGLLLVGVGRLQGLVVQGTLSAPQVPDGTSAAVPWEMAGRGAFVARILGFVGAGVYEEMLFRLMLLPPVLVGIGRLITARGVCIGAAVILTSVLFSAAHYWGPHGEPFDSFSFWFRCTAGAFFALLFVHRGFGIAAGTHAMYDIMASLS